MKKQIKKLLPLFGVYRSAKVKGKVAITFDDGPNTHTTPLVIEKLRRLSVKSTFFLLGREIAKSPEVLRLLSDEGHEIASHGYDHSFTDLRDQHIRCITLMDEHGAIHSDLFRPAAGRVSLKEWILLKRCRTKIILWSFDAHDSMRHEGKWNTAPAYDQISDGDIILMHDDNPVCVNELASLVESLRMRGLEPVTVSELLGMH